MSSHTDFQDVHVLIAERDALAAELAQAQARVIELSDMKPATLKQRVQDLEIELAEARKPLESYLEFWKDRRIAALEAALRGARDALREIEPIVKHEYSLSRIRISEKECVAALATAEPLVDLKDPHNAHHPDRLKGPGLTVQRGEMSDIDWKEVARNLEFALRGLYDDQVDYLTLNNLGGLDNHWMRATRIALVAYEDALNPPQAETNCDGERISTKGVIE